MAPRRLRFLSPATARQLFIATAAPFVDYAANFWTHTCRGPFARAVDRYRMLVHTAQALTGAFRTVATAVVEAEAR